MNRRSESSLRSRLGILMREWGNLVTIAALIVLVALSVGSHLRYLEARNALDRTQLGHMRATVQDRLIGSVIDLAPIGGQAPGTSVSVRTLLWIVDLERCHGCFDSVNEWTQLERLEGYDLWLVLIGPPTADVDARLRALSKTRIRQVPRDSVVSVLGPTPPNTKMLLDDEGIVLLVDSRASGQDCGWNFEAQVGALSGLESARRIRWPLAPG